MSEITERNRQTWSSGDWDRLADNITAVGAVLLDRVGVGAGTRLLDVGTGSGSNVAIPAALRGASVVGADLTDAWFDAGRRRAAEAGADVEWVVGDAEALPFADASFDVVASTFGHMFAPDHARAAAELVRVCRPGGVVAFATWLPTGMPGAMFGVLPEFLPAPPPGVQPPPLWGDRAHVASLFSSTPEFSDEHITRPVESVDEWLAKFTASLGPLVQARAALGDRWPALESRLRELVEANVSDGMLRSDWLLTVVRP